MDQNYEEIAQQLAQQVTAQLPGVLNGLLQTGFDPQGQPLQLQCHLTSVKSPQRSSNNNHVQVASVEIGAEFAVSPTFATSQDPHLTNTTGASLPNTQEIDCPSPAQRGRTWPAHNTPITISEDKELRPKKRRKKATSTAIGRRSSVEESLSASGDIIRREGDRGKIQIRKRTSDNPALQPSSLEKLINGIWDSLFSGSRMDPTEIIEQWQAIESSGQPKLLTDNEQDIATRRGLGMFGRMNVLTRKISQTTRACRSLEVIVQAYWVQCFDDRVNELCETLNRDKAKKTAISEACIDFNWTEKELRNKMAIWRGYHDIQNAAGWVALVFAGMGLYRFCKYRVSFTNDALQILRSLRHRFEVAADTLHPRWRTLLGIVGASTEPKYRGHHHDWVVNGPGDEAIPLRETYLKWDKAFAYEHIWDSVVDEDAWGDFDPRTLIPESNPAAYNCQNCGERQSSNPTENSCTCYPNLYGSPKAGMAPVQIFRTANGKNNGLIACCAFEKGWAVGEFVGEITSGIKGLDVMIDRTDRAGYQIWQGRKGNHTRFVNHSCEPNSHYERFVWLGTQRCVLVSNGIEAGTEVTVDYGHTYWNDLDKDCLCEKPSCRYSRRVVHQLVTPPHRQDE